MSFWDLQHCDRGAVALVDEAGRSISYSELHASVETAACALRERGQRCLGMLLATNRRASLVAYLACLRAGHIPLLLSPALPDALKCSLLASYRPRWVMGEEDAREVLAGSGIPVRWLGEHGGDMQPHPDLGLLLSTSGSTGSARLVRLSCSALEANAASISQFLGLGTGERAITTLPPHYSYGLSVINSHLRAGACVVLNEHGVLEREFWTKVQASAPTSMAGVPSTYQMLHRVGLAGRDLPSLRTLTQAGGRLEDRLIRSFHALSQRRGWRFFVMYGQTEATARIGYVPPERLGDKIGAIGVAIPGGHLALDPATDEIIYRGHNVMMGYAACRADLARPDELHGILRTGELGRVDSEGFFYLTGRLKRFVKLAGNRVGLDEVETMLQDELEVPVAVGGCDDAMIVWLETTHQALLARAADLIRARYGFHHSLYRLVRLEQLPLLSSGKKDYAAMLEAS